MTECNSFDIHNLKNMCRACLKVTDEIFPMTTEEIKVYQSFADKVTNNEDMILCLICKWMLKKMMKFTAQVQRASEILNQVSQMDTKSYLFLQVSQYDIITTSPVIVSVHPELGATDDVEECVVDDNVDDDDEIPLVMLQDFKSKRRKIEKVKQELLEKAKSETFLRAPYKCDSCVKGFNFEDVLLTHMEKHRLIEQAADIKKEQDIKQECDLEDTSSKRGKKKKEIREGFTSRMRQETEEYVVIKLSVEQVKQELLEKAKSETFLRAPYKCDSCVKGFNFEDVLLTHMEKHRLEHGTFQCSICTQYCPSIVSLRGHMKSHTTRYKCKLCGQVRLSRQHLLEHYTITHTLAPTTYTCDKCNFTTNKRTVIQRHVRSKHGANEGHPCHTCGNMFNTIESLRVHTMRHDKSKRLHCNQCDKHFIYPSLLHKHIQAVHERKEYYCVECDIKFKSPESMRLHFKKAKRHRDDSSYKYECPHCRERFVSTATLSVHLSTTHGEPKQHTCDICNNQYSSKEALRGHIWRVHNHKREPPANCHLCEKTFTRKSILKVHIRTHSGVRPYTCTCGATFTQKHTLNVHAAKHAQKQDNLPTTKVPN